MVLYKCPRCCCYSTDSKDNIRGHLRASRACALPRSELRERCNPYYIPPPIKYVSSGGAFPPPWSTMPQVTLKYSMDWKAVYSCDVVPNIPKALKSFQWKAMKKYL